MLQDENSAQAGIDRRAALRLIGGAAGGLVIAACGRGGDGLPSAAADDGSGGTCIEVRDEVVGPYPANGSQSNVTNVLADARVFRSDITADLDGTDVQDGVPLALTIALEDVSNGCAPLVGAAVYVWHCNADGDYSAYAGSGNGEHTAQTFLRGVQVSDGNGQVTFRTVYPGRYAGRATHVHVQVYADDSFSTLLKTTQFAFDDGVTDSVYASSGSYDGSEATQATRNEADGIFSDGYEDELVSLDGSADGGYTADITIGVSS